MKDLFSFCVLTECRKTEYSKYEIIDRIEKKSVKLGLGGMDAML
jgi:DNA-binding PadR family transcriptional regulator